MNKIDRVEIAGFWGNRELAIDFFSDVNFFIGVNGSGKTTVINIIAAALAADFPTLDRLPFKTIRIELSEVGGRKKPSIEVEKVENEDTPYASITYRIKEKASEKYKEYSLDEFEEEALIRRRIPTRQYRSYMRQRINRGILARLESIANVSWLSIHRSSSSRYSAEVESYESSVDQKLEELSNDLGKYFSVLASKVSDEIAEFQRNIISSLLTEQTESAVFSLVKSFDLEEEKKALNEIFKKLKIGGRSAESKIDKHFLEVREARDKLGGKEGLDLNDLMTLVNSYRSHRVVENWNKLLKKQAEILKPKATLVKVLNSLFQRKVIYINETNEIEATTDSGKRLSIRGLSSGEKQLIIILGEALLQRESPWIYIADEPELSLHVRWQEKLIENLRLVNPQAQIICATHSPDVVSTFANNIFDMESMIK
ncbi:MAG TPA: AAA family ATPase [Gammaproteobacteria bacterium]|nr:AAA family ATPase [Gammaproteobacteria bacterium]